MSRSRSSRPELFLGKDIQENIHVEVIQVNLMHISRTPFSLEHLQTAVSLVHEKYLMLRSLLKIL